jgi:hypothetical protein
VAHLTPQNIRDGLIGGAIVVAFLLFDFWRSRRPRYITDERGERQRVIAWNRGQPVFDPKTWQQRIHEEVVIRRDRRKWIFGGFLWVGIMVAVTDWAYQFGDVIGMALFWFCLISSGAIIAKFVPAFLKEIAYQFGYQGMEGAKVLDRQPTVQPGREVVEEQKAHGDARLAGEAEALSLLNSKK